jgi:hypothetical protein
VHGAPAASSCSAVHGAPTADASSGLKPVRRAHSRGHRPPCPGCFVFLTFGFFSEKTKKHFFSKKREKKQKN